MCWFVGGVVDVLLCRWCGGVTVLTLGGVVVSAISLCRCGGRSAMSLCRCVFVAMC